jgi:hypothetical protein
MKQHFSAILATAFFLFPSFPSFAQGFGQTETDSIDCDIAYVQNNWQSLGFTSRDQALVAELISFLSMDIRIDDDEVQIVNLPHTSCVDSLITNLPHIDVTHLWTLGIHSDELDTLALVYDLYQDLTQGRELNLAVTEATLQALLDIRENEVVQLQSHKNQLESLESEMLRNLHSIERTNKFLEEVVALKDARKLKKQCGDMVVKEILPIMSKKSLRWLKFKFQACQCLAKKD